MSDEQVAAESAEVDGVEAANIVADPNILESSTLARQALEEITDITAIGAQDGFEAHEERVVTLFFKCLLPGYPGWRWTATLAKVSDDDPVTVMEVQLLPGDEALTAPDWVPWSERLALYRKAQAQQAADEAAAASAAAAELQDVDDVDVEDDLLENDFSDFDSDLDGVDIDSVDPDFIDDDTLDEPDEESDDEIADEDARDEDDDDDDDDFGDTDDVDEEDLSEVDVDEEE